jgi:hypothetical protein
MKSLRELVPEWVNGMEDERLPVDKEQIEKERLELDEVLGRYRVNGMKNI